MQSKKAENEWKVSQVQQKPGRRQLTTRESKRSSNVKRKRSSQEIKRKPLIKLDLKKKLAKQRGNTSRNMSVKKRSKFERSQKSSMKCFLKKKSSDKRRKLNHGLGQSRREMQKEQAKQGLMGMLKQKVQRSQKNLSRIAHNYKSKIKDSTPKTKEKSGVKYRSHNKSRDCAQKSSFKMKENRTNWQIKFKKKKFGAKKIEKVIKAFDERCRRIDRKLGTSKHSKKVSVERLKKSKNKRKKKLKNSLRSPLNNSKAHTKREKKEGYVKPKEYIENQIKSGRLEMSTINRKREKVQHQNSQNSEYMLRPVKMKEKSSLESIGISRQSSRQQLSIRKTFKESTCSENEIGNLQSTHQKERTGLQKSGKSTVGLWSSSIRNIHQNQVKLNVSKKIRSSTAKDKKQETRELKKFLSPERIKSHLLKQKPKRKFGNDPSREFFFKYKRNHNNNTGISGSKINFDSQCDKSKSRVITGEKTPNSKKNKRLFDSGKRSNGSGSGSGYKKMKETEKRWNLNIWELEDLVNSLHGIGMRVGSEKRRDVMLVQRYLIQIEDFLNSLIDCGTESEHFFQSKWIIVNRRLLRRCNSISEQAPQIKSSFGGSNDLTSLQEKLGNLTNLFENISKIYQKAIEVIRILIKDVIEILKNRTLEKKNLIRIVHKLFEMTIDENLKNIERRLKNTLRNNLINGSIQLEQDIFISDNSKVSLEQSQAHSIKMPFTPETVVKKQKKIIKKPKNYKKIKTVNAKELEKLMDKKQIEVGGLRDILKKSKKGFKDFLRSFGWSDHEIEDAMRTASIRESPQTKIMMSRKQDPPKVLDNTVQNEYQLENQIKNNTKSTFTKNIVIKEYVAADKTKKENKMQSDFFSKQTNILKQENEEEKTDVNVTIYQPSKIDLDRMSFSNNLSEIHTNKPEDINIYSENQNNKVEGQRLSVLSQRRVTDTFSVPVSDPEFSNKKFVKNQKMRNYLEKCHQNTSNKSFISLQENKDVFSRKNSSMHESGCFKVKSSLGSKKLGSQVKFRLVQKTLNEPKSFRFSDILEEKKKSLNVKILEYPEHSNCRGMSLQSSKSVEHLMHGGPLNNTRHASYMKQEKPIIKPKTCNKLMFKKYDKVCTEILTSLINETYLEHIKEKQIKRQKDQESQQVEKEKKKRKWGKSVRKFERQTREYLSSKEFPWKIASEEVLEFLNHFAEFLCTNKLQQLVQNINIEYGPSNINILKECQGGKGVDTSTFRECREKAVISEEFFHEFFYMSKHLQLLGEHPANKLSYFWNPQLSKPKLNQKNLFSSQFSQNNLKNNNSITKSDFTPNNTTNQKPFKSNIEKDKIKTKINIYLVLEALQLTKFPKELLKELSPEISTMQNLRPNSQTLSLTPKQKRKLTYLKRDFQNQKMILDCLNEALCSWRPFAIKGRPLPSSSHFGRLNKMKIQPSEMKYIFSVTINKLLEYVSLLCGVLPERENILKMQWNINALSLSDKKLLNALVGSGFSDPQDSQLHPTEMINKIREDKLVRFLNWDIYETDDKWLFYDYEILESQLHLDRLVFEFLVEEMIFDFVK